MFLSVLYIYIIFYIFFVIICIYNKGVCKVNKIIGEVIGDIHITVCKTSEGNSFFKLQTDNDDLLPVLDVIEDTLNLY